MAILAFPALASEKTSPQFRRRIWGRRFLIGLAVVLSLIVLGIPMAVIFSAAFGSGMGRFWLEITKPDTMHAVWLTVLTAIVVVPINMAFGVCVAWLVTRFRFPGRRLLISFIEIPFSVSPIIAGTAYLFLYGAQGMLGPLLESYDIKVMFTVPAIFLVSLFVTSPFVARELIPLMEIQGGEDEEAALSLGASGLQTFFYVTLPNIKWALLYGAVLCNARVMGEYGAASIVSGAIRGKTNTLPLQVDLLFQDQNTVGAFAAASTLAVLALLTLVLKVWLERKQVD